VNGILWRWEEKDFGFRFRDGEGRRAAEYYQARNAGEFYVVPGAHRKLKKARIDELVGLVTKPNSLRIVSNPWRNYDQEWDWIETKDGICLNWAGCLDKEQIDRREDEGVQRAMELVAEFVQRPEPVPLTVRLMRQLHTELMGDIYPFAGEWRTVALHKGDGPTRWPLPPGGIQPVIDVLERDVLSRSPFISDEDEQVFAYTSEIMNEILAIHPFREGNGRTAFVIGNLILLQNGMLSLTTFERRSDEVRYFAACEAGRIHKDYAPLTQLLSEWQASAAESWTDRHG
jgi:cell filamentation protein